jgi:uncharacterized protein involved in outer membrane biogenesis
VRIVKWLAGVVAVALLLTAAAVVALPYVVDMPRVQGLISSSLTQVLGRPVKFSALSVSVLPLPAMRRENLEVAEDPRFGDAPFLTIRRGSFRLRLLPLLAGRMEFSELTLDSPRVTIIRDSTGGLNIASLGVQAGAAPPVRAPVPRTVRVAAGVPLVSRVRIQDGVMTYVTGPPEGGAVSYRLSDLKLSFQGIGPSSPIQFAGTGSLDPGRVALKIHDGIIALPKGRSMLEAPLKARLAISTRNVAELAAAAVGPSPRIGGPLSGTLALSGTVGAPSVSGELELTKLMMTDTHAACPSPKRRTLILEAVRVPVSFTRQALTSQPVTARLARGTISADVTWDPKEGAVLHLREAAIRSLPLAPVLDDYLCQGYAVTGPLDLTGTATLRLSDLLRTLSGAGQLRIGAGRVVGSQALKLFESVVRVSSAAAALLNGDGLSRATALDFESITASYEIRNGVFSTNDLKYASRKVEVSAAGRYGLADDRVNVDLRLKSGLGEIGAKVTGTAASPTIRLDPNGFVSRRAFERGIRDVERGVHDLLRRLR